MAMLDESVTRFTNIENLSSTKLFCKTTLLPILQKRIEESRDYLYNTKDKIIWKMDVLNRCFEVNDYWNAAYESIFRDYKLVYGKPSSVIIYEDLMVSLSLE